MSRGAHWTDAEIEELKRLARAGFTKQSQLAKHFKRSPGSIYEKLRLHCNDLLPPKRMYRGRYDMHRERIKRADPPVPYGYEDKPQYEPWKPGDPKPEWLRRAG